MRKNKLRVMLAGFSILVTGACGSQSANPATTPSPTVSVDSSLVATLSALEAPDASTSRGAMPTTAKAISQLTTQRDCSTVAKWLGIAIPSDDALSGPSGKVVCASDNSETVLPTRGSKLENGDPLELRFYVMFVPTGVDTNSTSFADGKKHGLSYLEIYSGPNLWDPAPAMTDVSNQTGGYTSVTTSDGTVIGIQRRDFDDQIQTRLAWVADINGAKYNVEAYVPKSPQQTVQDLAKMKNLPA